MPRRPIRRRPRRDRIDDHQMIFPPEPPLPYNSESDDYRPNHCHSDSESGEDLSDDEVLKPSSVKRGMKGEIKKLYEGRIKCHNCPKWVDKLQKDTIDALNASQEIQQYAVVVRYKRSATDKGDLKLHSIVVQSPLLRPLLEEVFDGFPGVTALERLTFAAPFIPFFHRWQKFQVARWAATGEARVHADLLFEALHTAIEEDLKVSSELISRGVVTFEHIWTIFVPGELIACKVGGHDLMCTVTRAEYHQNRSTGKVGGFIITGRYIDVGRAGLGLAVLTLTLPLFTGTMPISELTFEDLRDEGKDFPSVLVMPAKLRPDITALKAQLIERGRKFESLQGVHHKHYDGDMDEKIEYRRRTELLRSVRRYVSARVMIDAESYESNAHTINANLLPLNADYTLQGDEILDRYRDGYPPDDHYDGRTMQQRIEDLLGNVRIKSKQQLSEDQLLLCSPKVKGYNLKNKTWGEFFVDNIKDVVFDTDAFSSVVLPANYKGLISSFVTRHMSQNDDFDDIVPGKGKGVIILLSGAPGVGKTLTAETVAEETRAPLYSFGAGELGSYAEDVACRLEEVLELCARWKAVLLLDEADIFLQHRNLGGMERNKIVSVFLRVLEYYDGMMFMTTNRVSDIDDAFRSRIHVNMDYPPLDKSARAAIWGNFLKRKGNEAAVTKEEVEVLAERPFNGREIKNTVKIAGLLAGQRGQKLDIGHLNTIMEVNGCDAERALADDDSDFTVD